MINNLRNISILLFCLITVHLQGQFSLTHISILLTTSCFTSGAPSGVTDMNGDMLDDIVKLHSSDEMIFDYQNSNGTFTQYYYGSLGLNSWTLSAEDIYNNDVNVVW